MYKEIIKAHPLMGTVIPQKGDPSITVSRQQITESFQEAGVMEGDILMLHASLSSVGNVKGGAEDLVDGILDAIGEKGTFCVPSFWWVPANPPYRFSDFDPDKSPGFNGKISETVRKRPNAYRSNNPSHSIAAIGYEAKEITATHGTYGWRPGPYGVTAFAGDSPWERLYNHNAWYGFLGVSMAVNTMAHYVEHLLFMELYERADSNGKESMLNYLSRPFYPQEGWWPAFSFPKMGEKFEEEGLVKKSKIGSADLRIIKCMEMVDRMMEILHREPESWLIGENSKPFLKWL